MAQSPILDVTLYLNGHVWPGVGAPASEALAVASGRVLALGTTREISSRFPGGVDVDLGGRLVVPGLIDAHSHAIRGGATWSSDLHWGGMATREAALASIRSAAQSNPAGTWISAIGGWHETQFAPAWLPSREELDIAAPDHPVYVQSLYEVGIANSRAILAADLATAAGSLPGAIALDGTGAPSGIVTGIPVFNRFLSAIGVPTLDGQVDGTRAMFQAFAALGLTGVCDPGGFGMSPDRYDAVFELWRRGQLDVRTRLYLSATDAGREFEQIDGWLRYAQRGFGDEWLKIMGIGEVVHFGCHDLEGLDEFAISDTALDELFAISSIVAAKGWPMQVHAVLDESIGRILDCWERVDAQTPIGALRFSLAHGDRISSENIRRLRALGVGLVVDARQVFRSSASQAAWGAESLRAVPPLGDLVEAGISLGVGSDSTRASSHNPWLSLWWLVAGRPLDGSSQRDARHLTGRAAALDLHTRGSAWFSAEENLRGTLRPGRPADFAVLSDDYFSIDVDEIPHLRSELTVAGDRVSYSSGQLAGPIGAR